MAFREFRDVTGRQWRAWDIRPEAIHPQTRAEDYLADCFVVGWIVFETVAEDEKRRLCPYPTKWAKSTEAQLQELLGRAEAIPPRKLEAERQVAGSFQAPSMETVVPTPQNKPDVTDLIVIRSFRYPGGRLWTVCVIEHPEDGGLPALRFQAGTRKFDLRPWPRDWADAPDDRLAVMLRTAAPRLKSETAPGTPMRRYDDRRAD